MEVKKVPLKEWLEEGEALFGKDKKNWRFVCPMCGEVQSFKDFIEAGVKPKEIENYVYYSCIGRFIEQPTKGTKKEDFNPKFSKGCDWTLGGLFQLHTKAVLHEGKETPVFKYGTPEGSKIAVFALNKGVYQTFIEEEKITPKEEKRDFLYIGSDNEIRGRRFHKIIYLHEWYKNKRGSDIEPEVVRIVERFKARKKD